MGLIPYILPSIVIGVPIGAVLIQRIRPETFRRICMSFDAWIVAFGLSTLLKDLQLVESNRACSSWSPLACSTAPWLLYRFSRSSCRWPSRQMLAASDRLTMTRREKELARTRPFRRSNVRTFESVRAGVRNGSNVRTAPNARMVRTTEMMSINNRWFQLCVAHRDDHDREPASARGRSSSAASGWHRLAASDIQFAFTLFILFQTWVQPLDGWLIDLGPRGFITAAGLLCGLGWGRPRIARRRSRCCMRCIAC